MTSLTDIRKPSLPIYQKLRQAIRMHLEEGNKACLELCDKLWNGRDWKSKETSHYEFSWELKQFKREGIIKEGIDLEGDENDEKDEIFDDFEPATEMLEENEVE